jgi:parallel beta-helix repeat protein
MSDSRLRSVLVSLLLVLPLAAARPAIADAGARVLNPLDGHVTITRPGSYLLQRGFASPDDAPAIRIASDGVSLDLGGNLVSGPGGKHGVGILVEAVANIRVANGHLASFGIGAEVSGATNVSLSELQIDGEDLGGAPPDIEIGVLVLSSRGIVVERNTVSRTFLGIFVRGAGSGGNRIAGNTIVGGANGALGICYNPAPGLADGPHGDLVYSNVVSRFGKGIQTSAATSGNVFRENAVAYTGAVGIDEKTAGSNVFDGNTVQQVPQ